MRTVLVAVFLLFFLRAAAFAALPPKFGGTIKVGVSEVNNLIPADAVSDDELSIVTAVFEPLVKLDSGGSPTAFLIEKLPVESDDKLTYYFKLRDGVVFHNGKALDTADVAFTFHELVRDKGSPYAWIFRNVQGASEFRTRAKKSFAGVKIIDSLRFQIILKKKDPDFVKLLAMPAASIIAAGVDHGKTPVGTGPFMVKERGAKEIVLSANQRYHLGRPYLDSIVFRVFTDPDDAALEYKMKKLDIVPVVPGKVRDVKAAGGGSLFQCAMKRVVFVDMNPNVKPLDKASVRKQIVFAIDRDAIIDVILSGQAMPENFIPAGQKVKVTKLGDDTSHELWYSKRDPANTFVAERLKHDLFLRMGIVVRLSGREGRALFDDGKGAPSFRLYSLPMLMSMRTTVEQTLFTTSFASQRSAMAVRHGGASAGFDSVPLAFIYSFKRSYYAAEKLEKPKAAHWGGIDFAETLYSRAQKQQ